jgi:hypothetical protein
MQRLKISSVKIRFLAIVAGLIVPGVGAAQVFDAGQQQAGQIQREALRCSGTVKELGNGLVHMMTTEGEQWLVKVEAMPKDIAYAGAADASFLQPGMLVRFSSHLSKRNQATDPVASITVTSLREGDELGVKSDAVGATAGPGAALFGDQPDPKAKVKAKPKPKAEDNTVYVITGQLTRIGRTGDMTINAGGTNIKADLAKEVSVALDMGDLSYLQPGDKFDFEGWHIAGQKGQAWAMKVTAEAAQPLTEQAKKKGKTAPAAAKKTGADTGSKSADGEKKGGAEK